MKSRRFVSLFAVLTFATLLFMLAASQPNSAVQASPQKEAPLFQHPLQYAAGGEASESAVVADVNGDGIPDVVAASQNGSGHGSVGVLIGIGNGKFQPTVSYDSGGVEAWGLAVADVNGDGNPDILVTNVQSNSVGVLLGHGDGTFAPAVTYNGGASYTISVADVNRDGKPDLITGGLDVLLGNGDGTFQPPRNFGPFGQFATMADVNGDGKLDIVSVGSAGGVGVLLGNGDGTFQSAVSYSTGGSQSSGVAVGDLNGDGKPDIAVPNYCAGGVCSTNNGQVVILFGNGDGTFQAPITYDSGAKFAQAVAIGDVDGDGNPDLIVGNACEPKKNGCSSHGELEFLLGEGNGSFQPPRTFLTPGPIASIAMADVNGGRPDLILAGDGTSIMALYGDLVPSATALTTSPNPAAVGQTVTLTATITPSIGVDQGGETVGFYDGTTLIGSGTTFHGIATLTTSFSTAGTHKLKAEFPKNTAFDKSIGKANQSVDAGGN
jgi:hypothetical protein